MVRTGLSVRMLQAALVMVLALSVAGTSQVFVTTAVAANLTHISNTLSTTAPTSTADHTIEFVIPSGSAGVEAGESIVVTFPNGFNISTSSAQLIDYDLEVNGTDQVLVVGSPSPGEWGIATSGQDLTFTSNDSTIGANATVTIKIGSNADFGGTGATRITNPGAIGSYQFSIVSGDGANNDSGITYVAIVDGVTVTAGVPTNLTFVSEGVGAGGTVNGELITGTTTPTQIPFGPLDASTPTTSAQRISVTTNAPYGFIVTVEQSTDLISSAGATIDSYRDGSYTDVPTAWFAPTAEVGTSSTWGHWGVTTEDYVTGATNEFSAVDQWVAASTTPRIILGHDGPGDGETSGAGSTIVGYKIEVSSMQEAGEYETTLTYITTQVF